MTKAQVQVPSEKWLSKEYRTPTTDLPDREESTSIAAWVGDASSFLGYDLTALVHVHPVANAHELWQIYWGHPIMSIPGLELFGVGDPDQAWFWAGSWQQAESEADRDFAEGRSRQFQSLDDFFDDLDSDE
jgi:hypothetical protein